MLGKLGLQVFRRRELKVVKLEARSHLTNKTTTTTTTRRRKKRMVCVYNSSAVCLSLFLTVHPTSA